MPRIAPRLLWLLAVAASVLAAALALRPRAEATVVLSRWTAQGCGLDGVAVEVPARLPLPPEGCVLQLATVVDLPPELRGRPLLLTSPAPWAPMVAAAGGEPLESDVPRLFLGYRAAPQHAFVVPPAREPLSLVLSITNTWAQAGWLRVAPRLAAAPRGDPTHRVVFLLNDLGPPLGFATLVTLAVLYAAIYLRDRERLAEGYFAGQVLAASLYCLFQWGPLGAMLGPYDYPVMGFALATAIPFAVAFTHAQFGIAAPLRPWLVLLAVDAVAIAFSAGRYELHLLLTSATVVTVALGILYVGWTLVRQTRARAAHASTFLFGWSFIGLTAWPDFVAWLGGPDLLGGARTGHVGLMVFCLFQATAVSSAYASSLRRSRALNDELRAQVGILDQRQAQVEALNRELRRKLEERSESLDRAFLTLSRLEEPAAPLEPGVLVDGRYTIGEPLGVGGMGTVYRAVRLDDGARVALKVLRETRNLEVMARFAREARLASRVRDPHVVDVLDFAITNDGLIYLVMELVEGISLQRCRSRFGDVPWALYVLEHIARGLEAIHGRGVVHRDLKPANVLLGKEEGGLPTAVKIADFGVSRFERDSARPGRPLPTLPPPSRAGEGSAASRARATTRTPAAEEVSLSEGGTVDLQLDSALSSPPIAPTRVGVVLGTPAYLAPEVADGNQRASSAADVYSFGVMAHELVCGRKPPVGDDPTAPFAGEVGLSPALTQLLQRALARAPEERPSARELAAALGEERASPRRALA